MTNELIMLAPRLVAGTVSASCQVLETGLRLSTPVGGGGGTETAAAADPDSIAGRFANLLDTSADVERREAQHPAYLRVIDDLTPDEARILRLFAHEGSQPAVDVRTKRPLGVGDKLVAAGFSMIGLRAGCDEPHQVPAYLDNLNRLGLIAVSDEPIAEVDGYQVLEAQPEVTAALKSVKRATTQHKSVELTAFGKNFCTMCGLMNGPA